MSGGGPARVVLTAVMCTTEDQSADVTLGGVDSESTCLPLVLVRGPVQLRRMLFTWWQVRRAFQHLSIISVSTVVSLGSVSLPSVL